jgi:cell division protein FtsL
MNAAGRLVHQGALTRYLLVSHLLTRKQFMLVLMIVALLISALSVIYVSHATRITHASLQRRLVEHAQLQSQRGQLLLERSTCLMQDRMQKFAENKLNMIVPSHESIVMIRD